MSSSNTSQTALIVIDLQRGFFEKDSLAAEAGRVVSNANALMRQAAGRRAPIFVYRTVHQRDRSTWTLSMLDDDQGFNFEGSSQADLMTGLEVPAGSHHLTKIRDSCFHGTDLAQRLRLLGIRRLLLCGVEAENCLAITGRDAFAHDFIVGFAVDAIASGQPERGRRALQDNHTEVRQQLLGLDEVADWW
ncbi:MAG: isochorismatase family protein [Brooklawnia sp.]|uniref:cysteine hydrolase family protein n=1 Tax=Brooklawnia sp. TaxID=2699740 RepID=UPI003C77999A